MSLPESEKASWYLITKEYVSKIRVIRLIWGVSILVIIGIQCMCFASPYWVVNTSGPAIGYFGLWKYCRLLNSDFVCRGRLDDSATFLNPSTRAATAIYALSILILFATIFLTGLFVFFRGSKVLRICGWMLTLAGVLSGSSLAVFPSAWDDAAIIVICGPEAKSFNLGLCQPKWPLFLACINTLGCIIMAILAFTMADRFVVVEDEFLYRTRVEPGPLPGRGHSNRGFQPAFNHPSSQTPPGILLTYGDVQRSSSLHRNRDQQSDYSRRTLPPHPDHVLRTSYAPSSVYA